MVAAVESIQQLEQRCEWQARQIDFLERARASLAAELDREWIEQDCHVVIGACNPLGAPCILVQLDLSKMAREAKEHAEAVRSLIHGFTSVVALLYDTSESS